MRRKIKNRLQASVLPALAVLITKFIGYTLRFEIIGEDNIDQAKRMGKRTIYSCWHGHFLFLLYYLYKIKISRNVSCVISPSLDGEFLAKVVKALCFGRVKGSRKRGGIEAIAELSKLIKGGGDAAITPDGPRGPLHKVQPGVIHLAKKSGAVILPMAFGAERAKIFNSWDRFILPLPFSKGVIVYGEPMRVPPNPGPQVLRDLRLALEEETNRISEHASTHFNSPSL